MNKSLQSASYFRNFILGIIGAKISGVKTIKNAMRMVIIGGTAIAIGLLAGIVVKRF